MMKGSKWVDGRIGQDNDLSIKINNVPFIQQMIYIHQYHQYHSIVDHCMRNKCHLAIVEWGNCFLIVTLLW